MAPKRFDSPEMLDLASKAGIKNAIAKEARARAQKLLEGRKGASKASHADLANSSIAAFRGADGVAARLRMEFDAAPVGSAHRARILMILYDMVKQSRQDDQAMSTDMMSDQEIENEIFDLILSRTQADFGSPKTAEGRELLRDILSTIGEEEYGELEEEIKDLDKNFEFDKLAVDYFKANGGDTASRELNIEIDDDLEDLLRGYDEE